MVPFSLDNLKMKNEEKRDILEVRVLRVRTHLSGRSMKSLTEDCFFSWPFVVSVVHVKLPYHYVHVLTDFICGTLTVEINEGRIVSVVEGYGKQGQSKQEEIIDYGDAVIMPGLIDV